jgi:CDP-diacylglycerol--glycerol-3-phosphate 3-phosphatidyltransferase
MGADGLAALRALPLYELVPLIGIPIYWIGGFLIYLVKVAISGLPRTERITRANSKVLPRLFAEFGYWMLRPPVVVALKLRISPNTITWIGMLAAVGSGVLFGMGRFGAAGWILALSGACDALDGIVARETGTGSDHGEYFDSVIDRYADFAPMFGMLWYYKGSLWISLVVMAAIAGSQVMGYAKAKGEALGVDPKVGWMQRHERCFYLLSAAVLSPIVGAFVEPGAAHPTYHLMIVMTAIVGLLTNASAVARAMYVLRRLPTKAPSAPAAQPQVQAERAQAGEPGRDQLSQVV